MQLKAGTLNIGSPRWASRKQLNSNRTAPPIRGSNLRRRYQTLRCLANAASEKLTEQVVVVLGMQWGDEGKGKLVDILAQQYDVVARAQVVSQSTSAALM